MTPIQLIKLRIPVRLFVIKKEMYVCVCVWCVDVCVKGVKNNFAIEMLLEAKLASSLLRFFLDGYKPRI